LHDVLLKVRRVSVKFGGSSRHHAGHDLGHHVPPSRCYPRPQCPSVCPPPRPVPHCLYCVYYWDCHCGWKLYRCFPRRCDANTAARHLQLRGYRTQVQVKHGGGLGGIGGGPGGFPGFPAGGGPFLGR
jgi:hypothetical protein